MRVLLLEDHQASAERYVACLGSDGHEVVIEKDGVRGRARAVVERFDLVVVDLQLPGAGGYAICRELRRAGVARPVIALSAAATSEDVGRGLAAGFFAYLPKPVQASALRAVVGYVDIARPLSFTAEAAV